VYGKFRKHQQWWAAQPPPYTNNSDSIFGVCSPGDGIFCRLNSDSGSGLKSTRNGLRDDDLRQRHPDCLKITHDSSPLVHFVFLPDVFLFNRADIDEPPCGGACTWQHRAYFGRPVHKSPKT
jgi:hypothetical protein